MEIEVNKKITDYRGLEEVMNEGADKLKLDIQANCIFVPLFWRLFDE